MVKNMHPKQKWVVSMCSLLKMISASLLRLKYRWYILKPVSHLPWVSCGPRWFARVIYQQETSYVQDDAQQHCKKYWSLYQTVLFRSFLFSVKRLKYTSLSLNVRNRTMYNLISYSLYISSLCVESLKNEKHKWNT